MVHQDILAPRSICGLNVSCTCFYVKTLPLAQVDKERGTKYPLLDDLGISVKLSDIAANPSLIILSWKAWMAQMITCISSISCARSFLGLTTCLKFWAPEGRPLKAGKMAMMRSRVIEGWIRGILIPRFALNCYQSKSTLTGSEIYNRRLWLPSLCNHTNFSLYWNDQPYTPIWH